MNQVDTSYLGTIHFTSSDPNAGLPVDYTFQPGDQGQQTFKMPLFAMGNQTITVKDTTLSSAAGSVSFSVIAGAPASFAVTNAPKAVSGSPTTFTLVATDLYGNKTPGYTGTVSVQSSDPSTVVPSPMTLQSSNKGVLKFTITPSTVGSQTLTVTGTPFQNGAAPVFSFNVFVYSTATKFGVTSVPASSTAGQSFNVTVSALNAGNRTVPFAETIHFSSSDPQAVLPKDYTFQSTDNGARTFPITFETAGKQTITVTDTTQPKITGSAKATVSASTLAGFLVSGIPTTDTSGVANSVTLTAVDAYGNTVTNYLGSVTFVSSDTGAMLPLNPTAFKSSNKGVVQVKNVVLYSLGLQSLTVTDISKNFTGSESNIHVVTAATNLSIAGLNPTANAGVPDLITVSAVVNGKSNSNKPVSQFLDTIHFTSTDPFAVLPTDYTFQPSDMGMHSFIVTLPTTGTETIKVTDLASLGITGSASTTVTALNIKNAKITVSGSGPTVAGDSQAVSTAVPGQPLTYTFNANEPALPGSPVFTFQLNWSDGVKQTIQSTSPLTVTHVFTSTAMGSVTYSVTDGSGNTANSSVPGVTIQSVAMEPDPADNTKNALVVGGTTGNDTLVITPANGDSSGQTISVTINGKSQGTFTPTGHLIVYGQGGNDSIQVQSARINGQTVAVAIPALLFAGSGNSSLSVAGSSASNVLVSGGGKNTLTGGTGNDILIGGLGGSTLNAGTGSDILLAGMTSFDANLAALLALMAEWGRTDIGVPQKIADLYGNGSGGLNGGVLAQRVGGHESVGAEHACRTEWDDSGLVFV